MIRYYSIRQISWDLYRAVPGDELTDEDYANEVRDAILLGDEEPLPDGCEDIRGLICDEDGMDIYAKECKDCNYNLYYEYFGIKNSEEVE